MLVFICQSGPTAACNVATLLVDDFGRVLQEAGRDNPAPRLGIASVLKDLSQTISSEQFPLLFERFTLNMFADRDANVRHAILEACVEGVKQHGKVCQMLTHHLCILDFALHCPTDASHDALRMAGVVLSGTLAQHLDPEDLRIKTIFISLIENLSVRSQLVQESVANCLAPLVPSVKELVPEVVEKLLSIVLGPSGYGEKRGAAYGMAGLVKGTSVLAVRQLNVLDRLEEALVDQNDVHKREGACIALEIFSRTLKSLFDPFVLNSVSKLLLCTGDNNSRNVSATAVRLLMPHVLSGLDVDVWRTKCGKEFYLFISTMANGAPRHLAAMLPKVVPKLIEAAFDTHPKVQQRARRALRSIAGITKNPDVLGNISLEAIENPSNKTHSCLNLLLNTEFTHYIDAGSLALIMPILKRGFEDRSPEARKTSAIVTGNIYTISDKSDVKPYLPTILPGLQKCLLDPVPEIRTVAAKAMGKMVRAAGEGDFCELLQWLRNSLVADTSPVDRSGAAQGLSEIIGGLGESYLIRVMSAYLPTIFGDRFLPFLEGAVSIIMKALADETDFVRNSALLAGRNIVNLYSDTAVPLLLPSLEKGMFDDAWRIRLSSLQLLSEVLFKITGDEIFFSRQNDHSWRRRRYLWFVSRDRILSGLYISRYDDVVMVKQTATHAWKVVVANTPRTLREIMPTLFSFLLNCISSTSVEKQKIAGNCLASLVEKLGERLLLDIVPVLEEGLSSKDCDHRRGVCIALSAVMQNMSRETVSLAEKLRILPLVVESMCDESADVRRAASGVFAVFFSSIDNRSSSDLIETLLKKLTDPKVSPLLLDSLLMLTETRGKSLIPKLIPKVDRLQAFIRQSDRVNVCVIALSFQTLRKEKLASIISIFYQLLFPIFRSKKADRLPVFAKETGLQPLFAVVRECVISGKPVQKDEACRFTCALLTLCSDESIKPYAINTVGPMIRVLMDRQPVDVKLTILSALLTKSVMRPLIPQLQSTFMRLLNEPASTQLRLSASDGLVSLGEIHPKRDSLIVEVFRSMFSQEDSMKSVYVRLFSFLLQLFAAHMPALRGLLSISRVNLSKEVKSQMQDFLLRWCTAEKSIGLITSGCLGVFVCNVLTDSEVSTLFDSFTLGEWLLLRSRATGNIEMETKLKNCSTICLHYTLNA
ncbi:HEAT domain containing protein [Trichuris trichiura]|uniref:HEAT domain containing protein n=1 Tax=Trichuris trichiura TaxID=36087 RepID=A0A077Z404_TRITR|nr:HEAT domain containing protein [Trichuris trichiura]